MEHYPMSIHIIAESRTLHVTTTTMVSKLGLPLSEAFGSDGQDSVALALIAGETFAPDFLDRVLTGPWTRQLERTILFGNRIGFRTLAALDGAGFPFIVKSLPSPERLADFIAKAVPTLAIRRRSSTQSAAASMAIEEGSGKLFEHIRSGNLGAAVGEARRAFGHFEALLDSTDAANWLTIIQRYHDGTAQHCSLVSAVAMLFARGLGFSGSDQRRVFEAAHFHDVGKVHIPLSILDKPGALEFTERAIMESHAKAGFEILTGSAAIATEIAEVARDHHEYLDGTGYPRGIGSREIPDLTRIITICDIFAALIERRSYKAPKTAKEAYAILQTMDGKLDATLLRAFSNIVANCSPD
jgi:putative nucleotidyltransferase with HDIG domain